jgi:drug/metabolite transporter (DMT)-like permease
LKIKALLSYSLGTIALIVAMILFIKWLDWKFLLPLALAIAGVIFFWFGSSASKKK